MHLNKKGEWMELTVPSNWTGQTIEHTLKTDLLIPKKLLHHLRMNKGVKINNEESSWSYELRKADVLQIQLFIPEELGTPPSFMDLNVLFEDDHVLVVDKPTGMNVHPNDPGQKDTLANGVAFHFQSQGLEAKVRHIHRLDKDTTGAVIFAKNPLAVATLDRLLEQRRIKRTYTALVHGKMKKKKGKIDEPIGKDRHHGTRRRVSPRGQKAVTNYEVIHYDPARDLTLVELQLETGRTHQIRVHMSHIGHPLYGDVLYRGSKKGNRVALHAFKVEFPHPITGERIKCEAPLPEGFGV
ncbi:RluA family pseudouridine synthase [Halobacillus yeomjeoni]|uniref:Pseudouridine synthase n=1 Tax=Halobacillus yeomjeoni TaxID=311194 RepID=A0A931MU09_9BACI|nr:RluA family pseudouridine synthase [Halobacillus yeomjeoni]MBH0228975.1 RluA family pseudouridine synthase [Halobacillus yeomjeoni]